MYTVCKMNNNYISGNTYIGYTICQINMSFINRVYSIFTVLEYQNLYLNIKLIDHFGYKMRYFTRFKNRYIGCHPIDENTFILVKHIYYSQLIRSRAHVQEAHTISIALYESNPPILSYIKTARF